MERLNGYQTMPHVAGQYVDVADANCYTIIRYYFDWVTTCFWSIIEACKVANTETTIMYGEERV